MAHRIGDWNSLEEFGINCLTGESCAYSMRLLCDVNQQGKDLLERFFGGTVNIRENSNWNSSVNGQPAIGSVMLPRNILPELSAFCLLQKYGGTVYLRSDEVIQLSSEEFEARPDWQKTELNNCSRYRNWNSGPNVGGRNVHAMSGRSE